MNVVLPFCHGFGDFDPAGNQGQVYQGQYHLFGKLQENRLTREMAEQLMEPTWRPFCRRVPSPSQDFPN